MIDVLTRILSLISNALLVPVIIALLALLAWTLLLLGGFLKELIERRRVRASLDEGLAAARDRASDRLLQMLSTAPSGLPRRFALSVGSHANDEAVVTQAIVRLEHDIADTLARHSFITRVSPMLGLMGTLIPLGPALSGLAAGNMATLAGNLIVAFTATVVGLLISLLAYGIGLARRTWYSRDLTDLEFIAARLRGAETA